MSYLFEVSREFDKRFDYQWLEGNRCKEDLLTVDFVGGHQVFIKPDGTATGSAPKAVKKMLLFIFKKHKIKAKLEWEVFF